MDDEIREGVTEEEEEEEEKPGVYRCVMCGYTEVSYVPLETCPQCHRTMQRIA